MATDHSGPRAFFEPCTLDDYFEAKLVAWIRRRQTDTRIAGSSVAVVAANKEVDHSTMAQEASVVVENHFSDIVVVMVDLPAVHNWWDTLAPKYILYYILREVVLKLKPKLKPGGIDEVQEKHIILNKIERDADRWGIFWEIFFLCLMPLMTVLPKNGGHRQV